jgi:ATP-binding cassette, subfamily C (CFTR/MRP), member 1
VLGNQKGKYPLLASILRCLKWEILAITFPRLALVGFQVAQPFLIAEAVTFVESPDEDTSPNNGYGLIGAFALVFIGVSVGEPLWRHSSAFK